MMAKIDKVFVLYGNWIIVASLLGALITALLIGMYATGAFSREQDEKSLIERSLSGSVSFTCADGRTIDVQLSDGSAHVTLSDGRTFDLRGNFSGEQEIEFADPERNFIFAYDGSYGSIVEYGTLTYSACIANQ